MKKKFLIIILIINALRISAQTDSSKMQRYNPDFLFKDGIYLNFEQVKQNKPIPKSKIVSSTDFNALDFFDKTLENKTIQFYDDLGSKQEIKTSSIWGYCNNGRIIIQWNDEFNRIPYIGSFCHFVSNKTIQNTNNNYMYSPYGYNPYYYTPNDTRVELNQYLLDFETGKVYEYDLQTIESILTKDPPLYDEFMKLRNKKRKEQMFVFLRKYNEKHPLFVSK